MGAYQKGSDPMLDKTIEMMPGINHFLQQGMTDVIPYDEGLISLSRILGQG